MQVFRIVLTGLVIILLVSMAMMLLSAFLPGEKAQWASGGTGVLQGLIWVGLPMYLGIFFGQCFSVVRETPAGQPVSLSDILGKVKNSAATYAALFFSPILFFALFLSANASAESIQTIAFAFENGFFIQSVMRLFLDRGAPAGANPQPIAKPADKAGK